MDTLSPDAVADIAPATLIPRGLSLLFVAVYPRIGEYVAVRIKNKVWQIGITFGVSIGLWFVFALPLAIFEWNHLLIGIIIYTLLAVMAHFLLQRKSQQKSIALTYTAGQKIARIAYAGCIVFLVTLFGKMLGPFWGGIFTMFPAAFSSLMMILHWYYGPQNLFPTMQRVAVGSLSLFTYVITAMLTFPAYGFVAGTAVAYTVSLATTILLLKGQRAPV